MSGYGCGVPLNGVSKSAAVSSWHGSATSLRGVSIRGDVVVTVVVVVSVVLDGVVVATGALLHPASRSSKGIKRFTPAAYVRT